MKGNIFKTLQVFRHRAIDALKNYLEQRTPRQRIRIVLIDFFVFALIDVWMLSRILRSRYDMRQDHIETLDINP